MKRYTLLAKKYPHLLSGFLVLVFKDDEQFEDFMKATMGCYWPRDWRTGERGTTLWNLERVLLWDIEKIEEVEE